MRTLFVLIFLLSFAFSSAQETSLSKAVAELEKDAQFRNAIISLYVMDAGGNKVYAYQEEKGLAPASSLKVLTAVSVYELLGQDFVFKTWLGHTGEMDGDKLDGDLVIKGGGDPTLGSWRMKGGHEGALKKLVSPFNSLEKVKGRLVVDDMYFGYQPVPDTWIWQDMGNYFGAGAFGFNWHENKYDLFLKPGGPGERVKVIRTSPVDLSANITSLITTGPSGSGDKALIFASPYNEHIYATGTVGGGVSEFRISGAMPDPARAFGKIFMLKSNISFSEGLITTSAFADRDPKIGKIKWIDSIESPSINIIIKEFLNESINIYGEAMVKAIGRKYSEDPYTTAAGIEAIASFWKKNGISGIKAFDGSGLSVSNRVTTKALASVLNHARGKSWFRSFYNAMPEMNGMVMKSGYIGGVRAYAGYVRSRSGKEYTFAFIINNFDGSPGVVRQKMWKVLDLLK